MVELSVVMPIHNEEKLLPWSLPSVFRLKPDEVILIFDRCKDNSLKVARKTAERFRYSDKTKFIEMSEPYPEWRFRPAFLRTYGYNMAIGDIILNTDADIILDERIREHVKAIGKGGIGLVSFGRREYPLTFRSFIARLVSTFIPEIAFAGTFTFSKEKWQELVDEDKMKKILSAEDTYVYMTIARRHKTRFIRTNTIHLRPKETPQRQFTKGVTLWQVKRSPLWKVLLHSVIYLHPTVLVGYLYAKSGKVEYT